MKNFSNCYNKFQGEMALKGKLRDDFYELLEKHKGDIMDTQKESMMRDLQKERLSMEKAFAHQKSQMGKISEMSLKFWNIIVAKFDSLDRWTLEPYN